MCSMENLIDIIIRKFDAKKTLFFLPRMLRLCKSLGEINFLEEQNYCTLGWTWGKNQKHQILGSQNYLLLIKKV